MSHCDTNIRGSNPGHCIMLNETCRALVQSSISIVIIVADLEVTPRAGGGGGGGSGFKQK